MSPEVGSAVLLVEDSCLAGLDSAIARDVARGGGDTFREADGSWMLSPRVPSDEDFELNVGKEVFAGSFGDELFPREIDL